jgi:hypothetical protein
MRIDRLPDASFIQRGKWHDVWVVHDCPALSEAMFISEEDAREAMRKLHNSHAPKTIPK